MITVLTSQATSSPAESQELLEANKQLLAAQLAEISMVQNSDNYEDILTQMQKIDADIKLSLLK
jgi:hypothetical protein